jgi:predicted transcriptional regulator
MATTSNTFTATLKLGSKIQDRVRRLASARQRTPDSLMAEAIEQYVERQEKREQFRLETLAASERYRTTGLHLTDEEVDNWITSLENGEDAAPPECHV